MAALRYTSIDVLWFGLGGVVQSLIVILHEWNAKSGKKKKTRPA